MKIIVIIILYSTAFSFNKCSNDCKELYLSVSTNLKRQYINCEKYQSLLNTNFYDSQQSTCFQTSASKENGGILIGGSLKLLQTSKIKKYKIPRFPLNFILKLIPPINFRIGGLTTIMPISFIEHKIKNILYEYKFYSIYHQIDIDFSKKINFWGKYSPRYLEKTLFYNSTPINQFGILYRLKENFDIGLELMKINLKHLQFAQTIRTSIFLGYKF